MWNKVKKIYIWNRQVRPSGWKPWANTIAYYPLTSSTTVNDMSGNNRNLTAYWTPVYTNTYADMSNSCYYAPNFSFTNITIQFWMKRNSTWWYVMDFRASDSKLYFRCEWANGVSAYTDYPSFSWQKQLFSDTWWHLVTYTKSASQQIFYVDWIAKYTFSSNSNTLTATDFILWTSLWSTTKNNPNVYMSELIIEKIEWSVDKILDYYNKTKWNYWL